MGFWEWIESWKEWVQDAFMWMLIGNSIIYNMSWEDPRIDVELFKFTKDDVVVTLSSAGDQVLDYLIEGPKKIIAVDLNPRQNALLDLKLAGIQSLEYETFFQIFASSNGRVFREVYESHLRPNLTKDESIAFWDENQDLFDNKYLWSGPTGNLIRYGVLVIRYVFGLNGLLDAAEKCPTLEEQQDLYERYRYRLDWVFGFLHWTRRVWSPFIAVPASQLALYEGNIMQEAVTSIFTKTHLAKENYFYFGQLYGYWTRDCCPRYLEEEHFNKLRTRTKRVSIRQGFLAQCIKDEPEGSITCMSLLDHMDWMDDETVLSGWEMYAHKLRPGSRILWRSFAPTQHLTPLAYLDFEEDLVRDVIDRLPDRVMMYKTTHFGTVPDSFAIFKRTNFTPAATLLDDINVLYNVWVHPIRGTDHKKRLDSFYAHQATSYDVFRHRFLHGRYPMALAMPTPKEGVWVDMGGGTASNLEFFRDDMRWSKVYVLDLCKPLLDIARARVEHNGWEDIVELVEGDATDSTLIGRGLPKAGTVDVVTFSYSLTMIPDWEASLDIAYRLLKPGGHIAIGDFTITPDMSLFTRTVWPFFFSMDHVNLNLEHIPALRERFSEITCKTAYGGFPYLNFIDVPYYHFVGRKE